ncbi:MAG: hypothetical protein A2W25_12020 [candidate division Zixibacteria bacterium RBG_16_53_22]|nr:MAG: hypothetical protein A2W25_12020 [candidate division Zixibacteria bacterium RBG_16_53_22]
MDREISRLWSAIEDLKQRISGVWDHTYETYGTWHNWTAVVTQGVAVTVSPISCRYSTIGSTVLLQARLYVSTSGTAGQPIIISGLPGVIQPANPPCTIGTAQVLQTGVKWHEGALYAEGADSLKIQCNGEVAELGITPNFGLALYSQIWFNACYER